MANSYQEAALLSTDDVVKLIQLSFLY